MAITRRWSVKAEYAYFDFGRVGTSGVSSADDRYTQSVGVSAHTTRTGVNYRW